MAKSPRPKVVSKKHLARLERETLQRRYLIIGAIAVLVIAIGVIVYGILDQTVLLANRAVAKVDNQTITLKEFQTRTKFYRLQLINQYNQTMQLAQIFGQDPNNSSYFQNQLQQIQTQMSDSNTLGTTVLNQLIDEKLIADEAAKMGITVSDAEVEKRMQDFFGYYPNGTPTAAPSATEAVTPTWNPTTMALVTMTPTPTETSTGSPEGTGTPAAGTPESGTPAGPTATEAATAEPTSAGTATAAVTATPEPTATPYTQEGYTKEKQNYLDSLKQYGFTENDLRQIFRAELLRTKVEDKITADVKAEEDQVWARHILVKDEITAQSVEERLKKGEDFCKVAKEVSTDTSNKDNCGDLGWFGKGQMVAEFETAAFAQPVGQIGAPVKTQFGVHVIQVLAHQVRPQTADQMQTNKTNEFNTWLTKLQDDKTRVTKYDTVWQDRVPTEPALGSSPQ